MGIEARTPKTRMRTGKRTAAPPNPVTPAKVEAIRAPMVRIDHSRYWFIDIEEFPIGSVWKRTRADTCQMVLE
jgi:hypothetical protein